MNNRYTKEMLAPIIAQCVTWAEVCQQVGVKPYTGAQSHLRRRADQFGIDSTHFLGVSWAKGKRLPFKRSIEDLLIENSTVKSHHLRRRLIEEGYKQAECEECGLVDWQGQEPPLELDHINSDHWDCRIENLRILCANCHALKTRAAVLQRQRE